MILPQHTLIPSPRSGRKLLALLLGLILCVIAPSGAGGQGHGDADTTLAPDFTLETIEGDSFQLSEHRGQVVVVNFWATWCAPCRREIPGFVELQRKHGAKGVQFVGVALQRGAGTDAVRTFARELEINYPVGVGDGTIAKKFGGVRRLPTTFVIGPEGEIRGRLSGFTPKARLWPGLRKMLDDGS